MYAESGSSQPPLVSPNSSPYLSPHHLLLTANRKCMVLLPCVVWILEIHASTKRHDLSVLFHWDAGLIQDGCFFAGYLAANIESDIFEEDDLKQDDIEHCLTVEDDISICQCDGVSLKVKSKRRQYAWFGKIARWVDRDNLGIALTMMVNISNHLWPPHS